MAIITVFKRKSTCLRLILIFFVAIAVATFYLHLTLQKNFILATERRDYSEPALLRPSHHSQNGVGELGKTVILQNLSEEDAKQQKKSISEYGINLFLSEKISLHRVLKDKRHPLCRRHTNDERKKLPKTSVVIVFHNEGRTTLLRTIYSVLHNTPNCLLVEIILVDDFSGLPHLMKPLESYIKNLTKVRLLRTSKREGIVKARLLGFYQAKGEVVVFVDSHCECTTGWLEPLLDSIVEDSSTVAAPVTDDIDPITFRYHYGKRHEPMIGGFSWQMFFQWRFMSKVQRKQRQNLAEPIRTPTVLGGLFAVSKKFFSRIGAYDGGMDFWGGENVEFSFRAWMCGGRIIIHPCSHFGHISRTREVYAHDPVWTNIRRVAEIYLGDYKDIFYHRFPKLHLKKNFGDVSERIDELRSLHCHDFKWYLDNIYPERYIPEDKTGYYGMIKNVQNPTLCFDRSYDQKKENSIGYYHCHGHFHQIFELNSLGQLRVLDDYCVAFDGKNVNMIYTKECDGNNEVWNLTSGEITPDQKWTFLKNGQQMKHVSSGKCIELNKFYWNSTALYMNNCDQKNKYQQWRFF